MWPEDEQMQGEQGLADGTAQQQPQQPAYDPYFIEQVRQEIETAHEEFQRLLNGRSRRNLPFRW